MTIPTGPRWAVSYRPKLAATPPDPEPVYIVQTGSMVTAIKSVQVALAEREGGPFAITSCIEATDAHADAPVLPALGETPQ